MKNQGNITKKENSVANELKGMEYCNLIKNSK